MAYQGLVPAPELAANLEGKPQFFDAVSGVFWDGHRAFVYGDASTPGTLDALPQLAESVHTAVDYPLVVGNGSEDPNELVSGVFSAYLGGGF